jgi:hypothetical protein
VKRKVIEKASSAALPTKKSTKSDKPGTLKAPKPTDKASSSKASKMTDKTSSSKASKTADKTSSSTAPKTTDKTSSKSLKANSSVSQGPSEEPSRQAKSVRTLNVPKILSEETLKELREGNYQHEEFADRGYSQRDQAELTARKLAAHHANVDEVDELGDDESEDKDEDEDEEDEDEDRDEDEDEDEDEEESEPSGRPRRTAAKSHASKAMRESFLDEILGPDADSNDPKRNLPADYDEGM